MGVVVGMDPIAVIVRWGERFVKRTRRDVAGWCSENFVGEKALFQRLRIERRLGVHSFMIRGVFRLTQAVWRPGAEPGAILLRGFRKHRWPS